MKSGVWKMMLAALMAFSLSACGGAGGGNGQPANGASENTQTQSKTEFKYPEKPLDWTIAFGPGGGNDIMSRTIIDILKKNKLYTPPIVAENRQGGSGATGWGYLNSHKGDPYQISSTSGSFITTPLLSNTGFDYKSFTPVALMATDDMVFIVNGDSPYNTLDDFIQTAKSGKKMSIGGLGAVNVDYIIPRMLAKEAGFDFEYVPFQSAGESTSGLLSKSIDAMMANPSEVLGQIKAEKMKPLAFSGNSRIQSLSDVPTFKELGYNVNLPMPRGIVLAGGVSDDVQNWWIETMKKVAETPEWKKYISDNSLTEDIRFGDDFAQYLEETTNTFKTLLKETGAIK
ncbi:tripartite tricarboxylate transporter substrate binding protein [Paenibacillus naphthalenovorans]|uniref:tripartite tricarboxylate transporter substrate binding protein n=1 Tax=Paenibacillus naphthalenovorans TaxID=162209 RepID=UPI003D276BB3